MREISTNQTNGPIKRCFNESPRDSYLKQKSHVPINKGTLMLRFLQAAFICKLCMHVSQSLRYYLGIVSSLYRTIEY